MPTPTSENNNATASRTDKAVVCDALVSLLFSAVEEARSLNDNTDPLVDDILTPALRAAERLRTAFSVIDKWGAMWIDEHIDEEDPNDPTKNCVAQWCIGGDFFPAATHDVIQAALAFADKYADDEANKQI